MWYHFEYTSGANPYIAFNPKRKASIIRKWKRRGVEVERVGNGMYLIHDRGYWKEG